jgi:PAS domain S-box-containing protein
VPQAEPRILYVEDYQYLGILFQKVMARLGLEIDLATTGREGLEKFRKHPYEVVVLDYHLPDMTGIDIAGELLGTHPDLAVVLVTGRGDEQTAVNALSLGIAEYLVKDDQNIFLEKLPEVVKKLLLEGEKRREKEEQREALRESEARYRALFESSLQGIVVHDNYKPLFANQAYASMHGYVDATEICALDSILSLLPEDELEAYTKATTSVPMGSMETWDHDHRGVGKDGGTVWLDIRGQQIQWEGRSAMQIVAVDTTARRQAQLELEHREARLRESEAMLQAIQDNLPAALFIKEEGGRYTYVNKQFRQRFKGKVEDAIGLTVFDLFDYESAKIAHEQDEKLLRDGIVSNEEFETTWPDGRPLFVDNIKFPVTVGDKKFIGTFSLDITKQKEAFLDLQRSEKLLQESENYLRELIQTANAPIISLDRKFHITDWNKAAENITGYEKNEVLQSNFVDRLVTEDMQQQVREMLVDNLGDAHTSSAKITLRTKLGESATVLFSASARRSEDDQIAGIVCIGQDVTLLMQAQDQLSQSQKMEAVGQLTGGIAHDFNNLLQIISGAATMLDELHGDDGVLSKWIAQIEEAVDRGGSLTSQLLAFSRQQNLSPSVVQPDKVVSEIEALLQRTLGEDIQWNILVSSSTPQVFVDAHALQNAIINLCVNSRAAMPDGGELSITVAQTEISEDEVVGDDVVAAGSFVEISVADNGEGMTPEVLENAINPFFSTKSVGEGTGLGLSMVYGFSRQSDGLTRIDSKVGVGTRVSILLPVTAMVVDEEAMPELMAGKEIAPSSSQQEAVVISGPTVPDSFHNTNSINGFRGMFGLNKAII